MDVQEDPWVVVGDSLGYAPHWGADRLATGRIISFLAMAFFVLPLSVTVYDSGTAHYLKHYSNLGLVATFVSTVMLNWVSLFKDTSLDSVLNDLLITSTSLSVMGTLVEWTL